MSRGRLITFTNLFPSAAAPTHGLFVQERMRRVAAATGLDWCVVAPVPAVPWPLRADPQHRASPEHEIVGGVPVGHPRYFHLPGLSMRAQARRMARAAEPMVAALAGDGPCLIDAHYVYPDGVAALAIAAKLRVPCLVTARGTDLNVLGDVPSVREQIRASVPGAFALLAVSSALCRRFVEVAGVPADRVVLARNGVDLDRFRPGDRGAARAALGLPAERSLVLAVGRLVEGKGFHLMARALRSLPGTVDLVVIGTGPERERLQMVAPPGRLHLLGARPPDEVALAYRACDVLVLPSEREGWPNVVTEALASGLPVVATPVGAVPDMLTDPHVGALVRHGDSRALAAEVMRFLDVPRDRQLIRRFAERFGWDRPIAIVADLCERALGGVAAR